MELSKIQINFLNEYFIQRSKNQNSILDKVTEKKIIIYFNFLDDLVRKHFGDIDWETTCKFSIYDATDWESFNTICEFSFLKKRRRRATTVFL